MIAPLCVAAVPEELMSAPLLDTPTPFNESGLSKINPLRSNVAPLEILFNDAVMLLPSAPLVIDDTVPVELMPIFKVPAAIVVPPE